MQTNLTTNRSDKENKKSHIRLSKVLLHLILLTLTTTCLLASGHLTVTVLPGDKVEPVYESANETALFSSVNITPSTDSLEKLHDHGCGTVKNVRRKETDDNLDITVIDKDNQYFFIRSDNKGNFKTVLSETGYENAEYLSGIFFKNDEEMFPTAEALEEYGVKKITSIKDIIREETYHFNMDTENGFSYDVCIGTDGSLLHLREYSKTP